TANELHGTPGLIEQNEELQPEVIDTLELVLQHQAADWFSQLTLFHSRWSDGITSVANGAAATPFIFANLEKNRARGVTWDLNWRRDAWFLDLGFAWVKSDNHTLNVDYEAFPRYTIDAELGYEHAPWRTRFSLIQHWQIDVEDVFPPSAGIPAQDLSHYVRVDLGATHALTDRFEVRLFVRNLLDRNNYRPSAAGSRGGIPEDSISAGAEVRVSF
ncbi:MAG TPA: TonB-dependent receptor, partial [Gammaproteobacteria bacterium]